MIRAEEMPMDEAPTIVGSIVSLLAGATGLYAWVVRGRNKQLDVATAWQEQMVNRVAQVESDLEEERRRTDALEIELSAERRRTDQLSDEAVRWRTRAEALQTQVDALTENLRDAQGNAISARERIAVLEADAKRLEGERQRERDRAAALQRELHDLMRDVASGFHAPVKGSGDPHGA